MNTTKDKCEEFIELIRVNRPPLSDIESIDISRTNEKQSFKEFTIEKSKDSKELTSMIPADIAMCQECQDELEDKNNRRYNYPFITCTNCGPRFSIIKNLPYDRKNTSMAKFKMCKKCQDEYDNPKDRRYQAQPIGCFDCGPTVSLLDNSGKKLEVKNIIDEVVSFIADCKIVAIKGVGGYHLVCDARNDKAVKLLRERKQRPSKPFAVMVKDIDMSNEMSVDNKLFEEEAEKVLHVRYIEVSTCQYNSYEEELDALLGLKPELDKFFEDVMVNAEDAAVKNNRKSLVASIYKSILKIADIKEVSI